MSVKALDIKESLSVRHCKDFFTTECMSGPQGTGVYRFDAVAIAKSWSRPTITGYEIKVSRSDFKSDNKFYAYLPYFHELYIACPKGLIQREELPESIGLVWYNPETGEIRAKKRAVYRNIEIDTEMLLHIFYSHLRSDRTPFFSERAEYAKQYLEDKAYKRHLGSELGSKMAHDIADMAARLESVKGAEKKLKEFEAIKKVLSGHGIWSFRGELAQELETALKKTVSPDLDRAIENIVRDVDRLKSIVALKNEAGEDTDEGC